MNNFLDNQIKLSLTYTDTLRLIKQCVQLLKVSPQDDKLLGIRYELQVKASNVLKEIIGGVFVEKENATPIGNVSIAENFFYN